MFGLMTRAQHEAQCNRVLQLKDEEVRLAEKQRDEAAMDAQIVRAALRFEQNRNAELAARLDLFTGPRERGPRGRFLPVREQVRA